MKKHFIPLTALALLALVSCGGNNSSSHATGLTSESSQSHATGLSSQSSESHATGLTSESEQSHDTGFTSEESESHDTGFTSEESESHDTGFSSEESSSVEPVVYSAAISNKEALQAEWHVLEADRAVEFNLSPRTNITQAIADGTLKIESSNPAVVQVLGRNLHAAGEGTATITITYGDATDSVEITVLGMLGEPAYEYKNLTTIMEIEDLVASGSNKYSKAAFLTKVKVAVVGSKKDGSNPADKYGNLYVTDPAVENDAELVQVYGSSATFTALSYQNDGFYKFVNPQDFLKNDATKDIKVGDVLDVIAIRADYNTTKEISFIIRSVNGAPVANREVASGDVAGFELTDNEKKVLYKVSGKIDGWKDAETSDGTKYGNFFIKTEGSNEPVYVYGATASSSAISFNEDGSLKFTNPKDFLTNEATKDLKIGDEVTLIGFRCDYNGTVELNGIIIANKEPTPEPEAKTSLEGVVANDKIDIPELTVVGVTTKSYAVTDGVRGIYVYTGSAPTVAAGDVISLKGTVEEYHGYLQVTGSEATKLEGKTPLVANATILTAEGANALATASGLEAAKLYKWQAKATKDGNFWLFNIEGSNVNLEPVNVPSSFDIVEGATYDVEAYFTAYDTKYSFANFVLVNATKVDDPEPVAPKTSLSELDADGLDVELPEVTVIALNKKGYAVTDGTDYMYVYKNGAPDVAINDVISLKGKTGSYNGIHQITSPEATKLEDKSPTVPNATVLTPEIANAFPTETAYRVGGVFTWRTTAAKSGNFWLLPLEGTEVVIEPTQLLDGITLEEGESYTITAYYNGYETKNNYAQFSVISAEPAAKPVYKLVGDFNNWNGETGPAFTKAAEKKDGKDMYVLEGVELGAQGGIKVIGVLDGETTWYPDGLDNNYIIPESGRYNISFVPAGGIEGWHGGFFSVTPVTETALNLCFYEKFVDADALAGFQADFDAYLYDKDIEIDNINYIPVGGADASAAAFTTAVEAYETENNMKFDAILGAKANLGAYITDNFSVFVAPGEEEPFEYTLGEKTDRRLWTRNEAENPEQLGVLIDFLLPEEEPDTLTDTLDHAAAGVTGTAYTDWSYTGASGVAYAGQSGGGAEGKENLQLRSKNSNSGVVVTANEAGLKAAKVIVTWNTKNDNADTAELDLYGKDSAYTAPTNLYDNDAAGSKLAEIKFANRNAETNACEFDLTGLDAQYSFLGFRSKNGACYIDSIVIVWAD